MPNLNQVNLMGNLTRSVEIRNLPSGQSVGQFGLAINESYKNKEGEKVETVVFVDCEVWGKSAEIMAQYTGKGKPIYIGGRLRLESWEDKEGNKRSKMKVVVESFQFLHSKPQGEDSAPPRQSSPAKSQPGARPPAKPRES